MTNWLRVAGLQMVTRIAEGPDSLDGVLAHNLARAEQLVYRAAEQGCQLVVLPENLLTFGSRKRFSTQQQQEWLTQFARMARESQLWLVAGSLPLQAFQGPADVSQTLHWDTADAKPFATCAVFSDAGLLAGCYRKMHLFDAQVADSTGVYRESDHFRAGDAPGVVGTPWGEMGVGVCYDLRFPEYFRELRRKQVALAVLPSAFTYTTGEAHWELLVRARAVENQIFMVGVNQGGAHSETRRTWGDSMIVDAWGRVLARAGQRPPCEGSQLGEAIVMADLDLGELRDVRTNMPVWEHRRL